MATMEVQVLVPSQNLKRLCMNVPRNETVLSFRKKIAKTINVPEQKFLLIAMGKIMMDLNASAKEATLYSTYRVKSKTCVFVHVNEQKSVQHTPTPSTHATTISRRHIVRDNDVVSLPFGGEICTTCSSNVKIKRCKDCGCAKCLLKTGDPLICDQCDNYWHIECAGLNRPPAEQYWYCPDCINKDSDVIIGRGKMVAEKKKVSKHAMITIRDMECIIVPQYHVGKIPGIYCGQSWESRTLVHDWGIHRSNKNITYSKYTGAVSIVLTGGSMTDKDKGYQFVMSGVGGGLRTHGHFYESTIKKNQELKACNKALAVTCDAPVNETLGATAIDWRKSRPVRVCRSSTRKVTHPFYAPKRGIRYDGLYKLVKYWPYTEPTTGKIIWKFLFKRDDQELPPWMSQAILGMKQRGTRLIADNEECTQKLVKYNIPERIKRLIRKDTLNTRLWHQLEQMEFWSEYEFLHHLFDTTITCSNSFCTKPIKDPVTTPCGHICCAKCLRQSNTGQCFTCREKWRSSFKIQVNQTLVSILQVLNWAYQTQSDMKGMPLPSSTNTIKVEPEDDHLTMKYEQNEIKQEIEEYTTLASAEKVIHNKKKRKNHVQVFIERYQTKKRVRFEIKE